MGPSDLHPKSFLDQGGPVEISQGVLKSRLPQSASK